MKYTLSTTSSAKRDFYAKPTASREAAQLWVLRIRASTGSAKRDFYAKPTASREAVQLWDEVHALCHGSAKRDLYTPLYSDKKYLSIGNPHSTYRFRSSSAKLILLWCCFCPFIYALMTSFCDRLCVSAKYPLPHCSK